MTKFPLLFTYTDIVAGNGFVARVVMDGRALLVEEAPGDLWFYGVAPAGVAGGGDSIEKAHSDFREGYRTVLYDIAHEAKTFADFKGMARDFLSTVSEVDGADWEAARAAVACGDAVIKGIPVVKAAERPTKILVEMIQAKQVKPKDNAAASIADSNLAKAA